MKQEQVQAMREVVRLANGHYNYKVGNFEFDHKEPRSDVQVATIYVNCVSRDGKTPTVRFRVEHINDRGYNLIANNDIGIDWGARVCLAEDFDPEGNPVNAVIEDNAGVSAACAVVCEGILPVIDDDDDDDEPEELSLSKRVYEAGKKAMRLEAIAIEGIKLVADWEDGGSDALTIEIYNVDDLLREYPDVSREDAEAYFAGERDGFVMRHWTDSNGGKVTDRAYFPISEFFDDDTETEYLEYDDMEFTITLKCETLRYIRNNSNEQD